ncbi:MULTISPECIES: RlpA-like double-psi beta-barrel domain-containing protein [unclassified Streptomyces]|uniref:hypothetical protein n=1 Tax=unclassified Streptomyces TaxID=2593676 RepID=UPI0028C3DD8F|nr:hypothetical protein [Streptomyces sp. AM2-3-1]WNO64489.1 hypothetical protein RPQ02_12085 [Streptomyces sp. AM2-3-1]WTE59477.1 septal ring lytic transglycosylase RlpA family protein [Streptomyces sp. NBC_01617]
MSRKKTLSRKKKLALLVGAAALAGGTAAVLAGTSQAAQSPPADRASSVVCTGLATALGNNEQFIAGQRADPDAQSAARIANREAVIAEIRRQQAASGCGGEASAVVDPATSAAASTPASAPAAPAPPGGGGQTTGEVVCAGSTVTLSGEGGAPAASSNQFPVGTQLKVTNLDNNKSTTVQVTSPSGSCALLNNAAFEQVREPGKFLIRRARIERVG